MPEHAGLRSSANLSITEAENARSSSRCAVRLRILLTAGSGLSTIGKWDSNLKSSAYGSAKYRSRWRNPKSVRHSNSPRRRRTLLDRPGVSIGCWERYLSRRSARPIGGKYPVLIRGRNPKLSSSLTSLARRHRELPFAARHFR